MSTPGGYLRHRHLYNAASADAWSLNFTESQPLDDTHLLVAVVGCDSSTIAAVPGWSQVLNDAGGTGRRLRVLTRRGDGTTNGIAVETSSATAGRSLSLFAWSGYVSTALARTSGIGTTSGSGTTLSRSVVVDPMHVALAVLRLSAARATAWPGMEALGDERTVIGVLHSAAGESLTSAAAWSPSASSSGAIITLPASTPPAPVPPRPARVGATAVADLRVGDLAASAMYLGGTRLWP